MSLSRDRCSCRWFGVPRSWPATPELPLLYSTHSGGAPDDPNDSAKEIRDLVGGGEESRASGDAGNTGPESIAPSSRYAQETATAGSHSQGDTGSGLSSSSSQPAGDNGAFDTYSDRVDAVLREQYKYLEDGGSSKVTGGDVKGQTEGLQEQQDESISRQREPMPHEQVDACLSLWFTAYAVHSSKPWHWLS